MADLVAQDAQAPLGGAALDLEHLALLEAAETRMRAVERNRHSRHAVGAEPLVREPEVRAYAQAVVRELPPDLPDQGLEAASLDVQIEIGEAEIEKALVTPLRPLGGG